MQLNLMNGGVSVFTCVTSCANVCCSGATMVTIDEIAQLYRHFPVTVGFRKYTPLDADHRDFLDTVGERFGSIYVIGDFIAGNWRRKICSMLMVNHRCRLHATDHKPMQCQIVPFCAVFPESAQQMVLVEQQAGAFRKCKGFAAGVDAGAIIWDAGRIVNEDIREPFYRYREGMAKQRVFLQTILDDLKRQPSFERFLYGPGMLEAAIPSALLSEMLNAAALRHELYGDFVDAQVKLCQRELEQTPAAKVFQDYLLELQAFARSGAVQ
jgi:Fe-S-cluster containining protein